MAGDYIDAPTLNQAYERKYEQGMGRVAPKVWAYHPYGYIEFRERGQAAGRLTKFLSRPRVVAARAIWFTEGGAFAVIGRRVRGGEGSAAVLQTQKTDLALFLNSRRSRFKTDRQIKRFYYYEWHGDSSFDSGLIGDGDQPPSEGQAIDTVPTRPVECTFQARTNPGSPCPPASGPPVGLR